MWCLEAWVGLTFEGMSCLTHFLLEKPNKLKQYKIPKPTTPPAPTSDRPPMSNLLKFISSWIKLTNVDMII